MDRRAEIDDALEDLGCDLPRDDKLSLLNQMHEWVGGSFELGFLEGRIENLIDRIPYELDREVRTRMFDVVERAMSAHLSLDPALDPLLPWLSDDDPAFVCDVLRLFPRSGERKYLALVERYRAHPNEFVRRNAEYAWKHMRGNG